MWLKVSTKSSQGQLGQRYARAVEGVTVCRTVLSAVYSPPPSAEGGTPAAARLWHRGATHGNTFSRPRKSAKRAAKTV